ncbi:MAG: beta-N-acetylhexosaminidase [Victivallales bacterium]|nr:beta-N-acetylhexosaminidase [Victivallales bacterium]
MMKQMMAGLVASALAVSATALEINNYLDRDGFPILIPSVQKIERSNGTFTLPNPVTIAAPAEVAREANLLSGIITARFGSWKGKVVGAGEKAVCKLELTDKGVPESTQGYRVDVTLEGLFVKARTPQGLYYGVQTLGNIISNNITIHIPYCHIEDWPDLEFRGIFLDLDKMTNADMPQFCKLFSALGALKLNTIELDFGANLPFPNTPFTARKETLTAESVAMLIKAAKENYVEIVPHLQAISHERWLRAHPQYLSDITSVKSYPGKHNSTWNNCICLAQPLGRELTDLAIRETINIFKPKYFHLCMDELELCSWKKCEHCPDGHTEQQIIDEVIHNLEYVHSLGVTPVMYHDPLLPARSRNSVIAKPLMEKVPRYTVMSIWDYKVDPREEEFDQFRKNGFENRVGVSFCNHLLNTRSLPLMAKKLGGQGSILTYWGWIGRNFLNTEMNPHAAAGTVINAEYAWHTTTPETIAQLTWDPSFQLRRRLSFGCPTRRPTSPFANIPIAAQCNARLGKDYNFPRWNKADVEKIIATAAGSIESFKLTPTKDGGLAAIVFSGGNDNYATTSVTIPVNAAMQGFSLLMTAGSPDIPKNFDYYHSWARPQLLTVKVNYADGTSVTAPIKYRLHVNSWNCQASGCENRFVVRGNDAQGALYSLMAFDWNNPRGKDVIASIELVPECKHGVAPAILSAVAWQPKGKLPAETALKEELISNPSLEEKAEGGYRPFIDFENGMGTCTVKFDGVFGDKEPNVKIVFDEERKSNVLVITMPPPVDGGNVRPRAMVDVAIPKGLKLGTLRADYQLNQPKADVHSGFYKGKNKFASYDVLYDCILPADTRWTTAFAPSMMMVNEDGEIKEGEHDIIRFSIWFANYTSPIVLKVDNIGYFEEDAKWFTRFVEDKVE